MTKAQARKILAGPYTDWREGTCKECGVLMRCPSDLEPTPVCNLCAQTLLENAARRILKEIKPTVHKFEV